MDLKKPWIMCSFCSEGITSIIVDMFKLQQDQKLFTQYFNFVRWSSLVIMSGRVVHVCGARRPTLCTQPMVQTGMLDERSLKHRHSQGVESMLFSGWTILAT